MKAINEMEIMNNDERIDSETLTFIWRDAELKQWQTVAKYFGDDSILVEASKLSLMDEFMQHLPRTSKERFIYVMLSTHIRDGALKDFYLRNIAWYNKKMVVGLIGASLKKLVEDGMDTDEAWNMMCDDGEPQLKHCHAVLEEQERAFYHEMISQYPNAEVYRKFLDNSLFEEARARAKAGENASVAWLILDE